MLESLRQAAKEMETAHCFGIAGNCGFMQFYQAAASSRLKPNSYVVGLGNLGFVGLRCRRVSSSHSPMPKPCGRAGLGQGGCQRARVSECPGPSAHDGCGPRLSRQAFARVFSTSWVLHTEIGLWLKEIVELEKHYAEQRLWRFDFRESLTGSKTEYMCESSV